MTTQQRDMIVQDFEKYMRYTLHQATPFTLEAFAAFATSLINFYSGSKLIENTERTESALLLCRSFNAGLGNQISGEDIHEIANLIVSDDTLAYALLNPIFSHYCGL